MKNILLTSGGTEVDVDRVRRVGYDFANLSIKNMSHGTFGAKIAWELLRSMVDDEDVKLTFLHASRSLTPFTVTCEATSTTYSAASREVARVYSLYDQVYKRYIPITYRTYDEYATALERWILNVEFDVVVLAAAVSDYVVGNFVDGKIRSTDDLNITLQPAQKLIPLVKQWDPHVRLVGFKLLVDSTDADLLQAANSSIKYNQCDVVIANDLRDIKQSQHRIQVVTSTKHEEFCSIPSDPNYLARIVAQRIWELL